MHHPSNDLDPSVPQKAILELQRLVVEADERFKQDSTIEACSSLAAIPAVLEPLINHLQHTWLTTTGLAVPGCGKAEEAASPGQYL